MNKKFFKIVAMLIAVLIIPNLQAYAELQFGVHGVLPENQANPNHDFFHLIIEPGETQILEVILTNPTDVERVALIDIATATTNPNGVVEYGSRDIERDSTLRFAMEDIVTGPSEIVLPPNEQTSLFLTVQMPEEDFDGVLAGGITFLEREEETEEVAEGMVITNQFAFTKAIILRNSMTGVPADFVLNEVVPSWQHMRTTITANIQNIMPRFANQVSIEAFVTERGSEEELFGNVLENVQFAPNSNFDFGIPLEGERLRSGEFTLYFTLTYGDQVWEFEEDFEIEDEVARYFNENDIFIQAEPTNWILYIVIGVSAILVIANAIFFGYVLKKRKS